MDVEWGKLAAIILGISSVTLLGATGHMGESTVTALLGAIMGYVFGNGRLAMMGKTPQPLLRASQPDLAPVPPPAPVAVPSPATPAPPSSPGPFPTSVTEPPAKAGP